MKSAKSYLKTSWKQSFLYIIVLLITTLGACTDDPIYKGPGESSDIKIYFKVPAPSALTTRSAVQDDAYYDENGIYLLIFNGNEESSSLLQISKATAGTNNFYAKLNETSEAKYIYIIANMQDILSANQTKWVEDGVTLGEIKEKLQRSLPLKENVITSIVTPQPMVGEFSLDSGITLGISIGSESQPIELIRSTVKISLTHSAPYFKLIGANLMKAPVSGYLFRRADDKIATINKANSGAGGDIEEMISTAGEDGKKCYLYTFESVKGTPSTSVIVKAEYEGKPYYYRIDLDQKSDSYALMRNCNYSVNIKSVSKAGYETAAQAMNNPAGNIEYTVNVTDAYSRDIVSNGEYFLGVSNTEFYYFSDNSRMEKVEITTVTQNAPSSVSAGSCTASTGITITSNPFPSNNGSAQSLPLAITMNEGTDSGEVTLSIGDLKRIIKVYRKATPNSFEFGSTFTDFIQQGYISAKVSSADEAWLKLSNKAGQPAESELSNSLEDASENIYVHVKANLGTSTDPKYRTGAIDLFRKDNGGNAKVVFSQKLYDIFEVTDGKEGKIENPYAGAFWRHNQTGERVIKMILSGASSSDLTWDATVAIGADWAGLEVGGSSDGSIYTDTPTLGDAPGFDTTYKVNNPQTSVQGTGDELIFRIGLTNAIGKEEHRYGLVLVNTYYKKEHRNSYRIFLRQGDAPDYIYKPADGGYNWNGSRPKTIKFSPYNLTDPQLGRGTQAKDYINNLFEHNQMPLDYREGNKVCNTNKFTRFPSQAGYLFPWNVDSSKDVYTSELKENFPTIKKAHEYMRAVHPTNNTTLNYLSYIDTQHGGNPYQWEEAPLYYDKVSDPCPYGYRYPSMGEINRGTSTNTNIEYSEITQSLLFDPTAPNKSGADAIMAKYTLWGYYADGFFDRLPIKDISGSGSNTSSQAVIPTMNGFVQKCIVVKGGDVINASGNDIGYSGLLIFSPYNLASIFFPGTGSLLPSSGLILPNEFAIWTSERISTNTNSRNNNPMDLYGNKRYFGFLAGQGTAAYCKTVRCVKDETIK